MGLVDKLDRIKTQVNKDVAERNYLNEQLAKQKRDFSNLSIHVESIEKVRALFQEAAALTQKKLEYHISNVVSTALAAIWDDPYEFELEFVVKRGKTEANLWFVRDGEKMHPMDSAGGGAIDVASMALRIAAWTISKNTRPIVILDEPFRNLSENLQNRAADMVRMLSEKLGLQVILISHINELVSGADKQIEVVRTKKGSFIK